MSGERNPMDDLIKIPFEQTLASVHHSHALNLLILENQAQILSQLTGKPAEDILKNFKARLGEIESHLIDSLPKTI